MQNCLGHVFLDILFYDSYFLVLTWSVVHAFDCTRKSVLCYTKVYVAELWRKADFGVHRYIHQSCNRPASYRSSNALAAITRYVPSRDSPADCRSVAIPCTAILSLQEQVKRHTRMAHTYRFGVQEHMFLTFFVSLLTKT